MNQANKNSIKVSEALDTLQEGAEKIGLGNVLKDILKYLAEAFPFLAGIFGSFLNENGPSSEKEKKSTSNLVKLLENKEKSPLKKIKENGNFKNKEKLSPEKLKDFYEFLDVKGINYSKEHFWEEFLNGKSENTKIKEIYNLLNSTQDTKLKGTQFKYISLEKFIETLNKLSKVEEKQEQEKVDIANKKGMMKLKL
ncbi:MAG: hypothetical protein Q9M97_01570 [Candidatus Gracilibacteria bacterium]|nr:hypothetical protein [Candidatus Gracilibacteria bacterium]